MLFPRSHRLKHLTELELIAQYKQSGDKEYVGILFERYAHLVYGLCLKHLRNEAESKDAVLNIFEKLMTDLKKHEVKHFKSWLYMVGKNHCLMLLRKKQTQVSRELDLIRSETAHLEVVPTGPSETEMKEMKLVNLEDAISQLNEEQQTCIKLFYLEEKCYQEVSDITGYSMKQVKSYIQNGKRNLRNLLAGNNGIFTS